MNSAFYSILYLPHKYAEKLFWFIICFVNRLLDILRALRYDVIFIHRESCPLGGAFIERILCMLKKRIIFDFDDSIFLPNTSEHNSYIERFKKPAKVASIIKMSSVVIAGNEYLKEYASKYNANVIVIPSSIDTDIYFPGEAASDRKEITIGWIGSNTTKKFLYDIEDVFVEISKRYPRRIKIVIVGGGFFSSRLDNVINKRWELNSEAEDIRSFDIGIMPMPDNEWTKGKCGFKAILCMSCGVPVVASAVGANLNIIKDGVNGFLAKDNTEWIRKLSDLIESRDLRLKIGKAACRSVEEKYSIKVNFKLFLNALNGVTSEKI